MNDELVHITQKKYSKEAHFNADFERFRNLLSLSNTLAISKTILLHGRIEMGRGSLSVKDRAPKDLKSYRDHHHYASH